jgi:hypothetical protein
MKLPDHLSEAVDSIVVRGNESLRDEVSPVAGSTRKKPYRAPQVIEYGNVARLTAGVHGTDFDFHGQRNKGKS